MDLSGSSEAPTFLLVEEEVGLVSLVLFLEEDDVVEMGLTNLVWFFWEELEEVEVGLMSLVWFLEEVDDDGLISLVWFLDEVEEEEGDFFFLGNDETSTSLSSSFW